MEKKLNQSGVIFNEETHQYFLNGKELHGITGMLKNQLFPDEYSGIPDAVLMQAANRGTNVHKDCQVYDDLGVANCVESHNYAKLVEGKRYEASEYIVTDGEYFASAIDKVWRTGDNTFALGDIKTTYKVNKEKTQWQLSIYAYLFEMQNPDCKVDSLSIVWLRTDDKRDVSELIPVERIPNEEVARLLDSERMGIQFAPTLPMLSDMPKEIIKMQNTIIAMVREAEELNDKIKDLKAGLLAQMDEVGAKSWEGDLLKITRKADAKKTTFDAKKMRADHPELADMFAQYDKTSVTKGSILLTIK